MNIKAKFFTGAIALAVTASTVLAATNASAYPGDNDRYDGQNSNQTEQYGHRQDYNRSRQDRDRYNNNQTGQYGDRYDHNRSRQDRARYDEYRSQGYPDRIEGSLPSDFRRVVYRNRAYYTRDNHYYTYDSYSRAFITVHLPFLSIHL